MVVPYSLVSAQWLKENLRAENLIVLDASMKPVGNVVASQAVAYIPGSLRFDFDNDIREHNTPLPHMMPTPEFFAEEMRKLGVNKDSAIVAYDNVGVYASPRAWWMFRAMGHDNAAVLDGGLPAWMNAGYETSSTLGDSAYSVVDARSAGRFTGQEKEPREGLRGGHMPGAVNLPFSETQVNGAMKAPSLLREMFAPYQNKKLIFSCGSGVTACILALAAEQAGLSDLAVYDGSWAEWGLPSSGLPVVEG
ncbi:MAG: sulfurtransferase [Chloroflexi bacterium]|nr:sulfurtransferase [Chloroflexota bacterium]